MKDREGEAALYNNISNVYYRLDNREKVLEYNLKSLKMYREINNEPGVARLLETLEIFMLKTENSMKPWFIILTHCEERRH